MRILIVSQYYAPEPVPKIALLARALADRGHHVTVLTGLPCYPEGAIYREYKGKTFHTEMVDGVEIIRVPQLPDHSAKALARVVYYLSFPFFAALRILTLAGRHFDVAYFYSSAIPVLAVTPLVRLVFRVRCLYDVADLWPESVESSGMLRSGALLKFLSRACGWLYRQGDHLGAVTQGYKNRLLQHGIPPANVTVTYYCVAETSSKLAPPTEAPPFLVVFTGMMGPSQGLDVLLDSAKMLCARYPDIQFELAGSGVDYDRLVRRTSAEGIRNVRFLGRLPASEMPSLYSRASALFVHLKPDVLSNVSIPSKTYSYLAAGKPILMAVDGEAGKFVEENQCGLSVKAGDAQAITHAIERLYHMRSEERRRFGSNARKTFEDRFSVESHVSLWEKLLLKHSRSSDNLQRPLVEPTGVRC